MSTLGGIYNALIDSEPFAADGIPSMFDQVQNFLAVTDTLANLVGGCFTIESFNRKEMLKQKRFSWFILEVFRCLCVVSTRAQSSLSRSQSSCCAPCFSVDKKGKLTRAGECSVCGQ